MIEKLTALLHENKCSCVIASQDNVRMYTQRGILDLYHLYCSDASFMKGASIADKVIGKGAAALMVLGGIAEVYADVISTPARLLLEASHIQVSWKQEVPFIINRSQTGRCPLEAACGELMNATLIYPIIRHFVTELEKNKH